MTTTTFTKDIDAKPASDIHKKMVGQHIAALQEPGDNRSFISTVSRKPDNDIFIQSEWLQRSEAADNFLNRSDVSAPDSNPCVYIIRLTGTEMVKIGKTGILNQRLCQLQTCNPGELAVENLKYPIRQNYAENNGWEVYQPSAAASLMAQSDTVVPGANSQGAGSRWGSCLSKQTMAYPLNNWAATFANRQRMDLEGRPVRENMCLNSCDKSGNNMYMPLPYKPSINYVLPGGVPTAIP